MAPTIVVEKEGLLPSSMPYASSSRKGLSPLRATVYLALSLLCTSGALWSLGLPGFLRETNVIDDAALKNLCPQPPALSPSKHADLWKGLNATYDNDEFVERAIDWLGGAIKVPTESFDHMGPIDTDPRWKAFGPFHNYLLKAFPNVHATLALTKVNTYGLVYEWVGSDKSLKPLLLAAHQDVVPVNPATVSEWTHPPFSGHFDGKFIWGRGTSDDKNGLIGILTTIEILLENGFQPTRSIVLAFGFDEEASGLQGAHRISEHLLAKYGKDSFALLVDEGGDYMIEHGKIFATPGIAEKGYIDVRVDVESPGGHSSVPPVHTTIGILSALLVHYEAHPYTPHIGRGTPIYLKTQCLAAHAPDLSHDLRKALRDAAKSDKALRAAEKILFENPVFKALAGTTQAIDLVSGGVKTNALPESAWAVVNHRIATDSSVGVVKEHDTNLLKELAAKFNLSYTAFGKDVTGNDSSSYGKLKLSDNVGAGLEPAPITPTDGDAAPFQLLAGTIRATYNEHRGGDGVVVSPGIMSGNTDTRYYWKLTPHIFRYNHHYTGNTPLTPYIHTVNEFIEADAYIEMIRFFTLLILNADESTSL